MLRMVRLYIRVIASLVALAVLAITVTGAYYLYRESYVPEAKRSEEVKLLLSSSAPKADPGLKQFDRAMDLIREKDYAGAAAVLREMMEVYQDSARFPDARRVLGEMNLDRLFSRAPMPGKLEYTTARGDSLQLIAKRHRTTIAFIKRINNLLSNGLHPGDRLIVYPLDFTMEVDLEAKRITLLQDGVFFRDYIITGMHLPYSSLPRETTVGDKPAWLNDKKVQPTDERYTSARKWIQTAGRAGRPGIVFCMDPALIPPAPPAAANAAPPVSEPPPKSKKTKSRSKKSPVEETPSSSAPVVTPGIYLAEEDIEELSTLVRVGAPLHFLKSAAKSAPAAVSARR